MYLIRLNAEENKMTLRRVENTFNLQIVGRRGLQGVQGEQGEQGEPGEQGVPGQDGNPGVVQSIVAGDNVTVDDTDPANPIVSAEAGGIFESIYAVLARVDGEVPLTDPIWEQLPPNTFLWLNGSDVPGIYKSDGSDTIVFISGGTFEVNTLISYSIYFASFQDLLDSNAGPAQNYLIYAGWSFGDSTSSSYTITVNTNKVMSVQDYPNIGSSGGESLTQVLQKIDDNISGGGGGTPTWGEIIGNLSDQTDLQTVLDSKLSSADIDGKVSKTGDSMSGGLTIITTDNQLNLQRGDDTQRAIINFLTNGGSVWRLGKYDGNGGVEDFILHKSGSGNILRVRYSDGAIVFNASYEFPTLDGDADQVLVTDGNGVLTWQDMSGGGGSGTVDSVVAGANIDVDSTDPANPVVSVETLTLADISDVTSSAAEVNILDGATLSTTELNFVDGVTSAIQTQLNGKQASLGFTPENVVNKHNNTDMPSSSTLYPTTFTVLTWVTSNFRSLFQRVGYYVSVSSLPLDADFDIMNVTALATNITIANNVTGGGNTDFTDGQQSVVILKDNGTPRTISYGTKIRAQGVTLPTTTIANEYIYIEMYYNLADDKFDVTQVRRNSAVALTIANNLSDLANAATARTNLGLGNVDNTSDATKNAASATLANKTLTTPTIASFTNAQHNHSNAAGGGNIPESSVTNLTTDLAAKAPTASPTFTGTVTVPTPSNTTDAATKGYVDGIATGLDIKSSVRAATTANITLSGAQTIDGVSVIAGDRVLVKNQSTGSQNGIYVVASGAWSRSTDADTSAEVTSGMFTFVTEGTVNGDNGFVLTTDDPIVLNTTSLTFTQFSGAGQVIAGNGISKSGNTLSIDTAITVDKTTAQTLANKTLTSPAITTPTGIVKGDVGLGNVDNTSNATERAATTTLTNKRITKRVVTVTQSATPTLNTDNADVAAMTGLAQAVTDMSTNQTGTPVAGDTLIWEITDNGTARGLAWGAKYEASTVALPTTTVISTLLTVGFRWNTATTKWRCVAVA